MGHFLKFRTEKIKLMLAFYNFVMYSYVVLKNQYKKGGDIMNKVVGYRNMLSMTQTDMANYLGISLQAYWNKEHGKTPFSDQEKVMIKKILLPIFPDITIDAIFFDNLVLK